MRISRTASRIGAGASAGRVRRAALAVTERRDLQRAVELVELLQPPVQRRERVLAGDGQDRHRVQVRLAERRHHVGQARARHHDAGGRAARRPGEAVRHEAGPALVASGHDAQVREIGQAVKDERVMGADDPEDGVDPLGAQGPCDGLPTSKPCHGAPPALATAGSLARSSACPLRRDRSYAERPLNHLDEPRQVDRLGEVVGRACRRPSLAEAGIDLAAGQSSTIGTFAEAGSPRNAAHNWMPSIPASRSR